MPGLKVRHIKVQADRVVFDVQLEEGAAHHTDARMAQRALEQRPAIARHTCVNSKGSVFADVIEHTPLPHLLEHLAIDILVGYLRQIEQTVKDGAADGIAGRDAACGDAGCADNRCGDAGRAASHTDNRCGDAGRAASHTDNRRVVADHSDIVVTGTSEWIDEQAGQARVVLSCCDDLLVLQSFNEAALIVNNKVLG